MTQPTFWQKIRRATAGFVGALFLFTTVTTPMVEANFWEQRRDASRRVSGKSQGSPALMAGLSGSIGANDSVLPAVNGALGSGLPSVSSANLKGVPSAVDVRASALPAWLRGLPNSAGEIRDVALAKNADKAPVVVLIQDVHNVFSAQKNIAQIVSHIDSAAARDNRGPVLIGLEGGVGAFDIARFRASRGRAGHALATELLLKTNLIAGPEFYAFQSEKEPLLWGVETREDYIENAEAVRAGHPVAERVAAAIASAEMAVEKRAEAVFSPELKDLNRILAAHNRGDSSIVDLVRVLKAHAPKASVPEVDKLQKALDMEKGLDFAQVERERKALIEVLVRVLDASSIEKLTAASLSYRAGQMNFGTYHAQLKALVKSHGIRWSEYGEFDKYVQYVLLSESIDKFRLFDQIEDLKARAVANLGRSKEEKSLMGLAEDLRLVHRLVRHEFGPAEWKSYQERKTDLARLNVRLAEALGADAVAGVSAQDLAPFERFYVAADRRNDSLAANLMAKGKEVDAQVMVLVAGGFHTAELESRIKSKGYSVVTLTPAIGEIPTDLNYLDIFTVKNIPLEQFLKGEKLYFSPPRPLSYGAGDLLPGSPATADAAGTIYSAAAAAIEKVSGVESSGSAIAGVTAKVKSNGEVVTATAETGPAVQAWPTGQTPQNGPATGVAVSGEVNRRNVTAALLTGSSAKTSNLSLNGRFSSVLKKTGVLVSRGVRFVFGWPMRAIGSISQFAKSEEFQRTWSVAVNEFGLMFSPWNLPSTHSLRWNGRTSQGMKGWGIFMGTTLLTAWVVASALLLPFGLDNNSLILAQGAFTLALTAPLSLPMHVAYNYSPLAKKFGRLTADELSTETLERLKAEILNTETRYFNLRTLSESYGMSVDAMSSILRKLGQEKTLRFPDGGWTSLLTIDRPEGAKGEGPFIARFQEVHRRGYVHHSVAVIAVTPDGRLVLQHRKDKNQFDVGASGHVDIGESPRMAAAHELAEELGIDLGKSNLTERLVPIPNPERAGGAFFKEGGKSFADFLYKSNNLDFSGPSKEKNNRENVHLYTVLLTEQEVLQIEGNGNGKPGKPKTVTGFLPLQFLLDFQERMADAASLFARYWFPQGQRPMKPSDREVDRVEIIDPLELIQAVGGNGEQYASSLRHFFQGEKIRSIVTGYLRGLLSAQELGQDLGRAALLDGMNRANSYGMTLVAGHPFSEIGILQDVVVSLRRGLSVASHGRIPDFGDKSHSTLAPLVRSKATPVNPDDLTRVDLNAVLATLAATSPLELEIESVSFGDLRDGSIVMTLRQVGEPGALQKLREKLMAAGLPFKFSPEQTGDRMYIQLSLIGPEAFAKMTESEIASVRSWMEFHSDLKSWWDLHRRFQLEEQKNTPGFSDQAWLETELKRPVNEIFMNVWRLEEENLRGLPLVEPIEMISEIMVASYSNRRLTGLVSQGVTLPLGQASVEFSNAQALVEQVAIVQAGLDYHGGRLKTSPVPGHTRPSVQGDVPYLPDMSQDEKERLAQIGLQHINKGTYAILAAGAASRMASGLPADVMKKLRKMWKTGNPPLPRSKAAVPIAEIGDKIFTFLGAFLTNVNAFYSALKGLGIVPTSNVLVYSNDNYISELETELKNHNNYGLPGSQIDRDLLQQLRPQFGAKVSDVKKMQTDGKFKNQQDYLFALEKARRLEEKLKQGEGEAALLMEEKAPHGHGEFLHDFVASGKLLSMIDSGKEWMFVRNVDNVGATLDFNFLVTLGLFIEKGLDFQVEVSPRLPGMKGGALIITQAGQQILTEGPSFAATWKVVEQNIAEEGYTPLEKSAGEEHIREVFRNGSRLDLSPTRMDFEGSRVDSLGDALTMLQDDTVRLYKTSDGKVLAVRHIVPESTYWFNNATAIISPRFFYFVYRRDDNQTYDEFVEEMRRAMSSDHGGLQAIAQRGKARFPILLDAKPTKSGGVGQKPETNMWQSTQAAIEKIVGEVVKIAAVGVDSLKSFQGKFGQLRFAATKQWEGPVESYDSNSAPYEGGEPLYERIIKKSWDQTEVSGISALNVSPSVKQGGFFNFDNIILDLLKNRIFRSIMLLLGLFLFSPALTAAPAVALDLAASAAGWDWSSVGLVGMLGAGAAGTVYSAIFGISGPGEEKSLFEQTGRIPFGDSLVPEVGPKLNDLKARTADLNSLYLATETLVEKLGQRKMNLTDEEYTRIYMQGLTGESVTSTVEAGRSRALLQPDRLNHGAAQLADAVGEKAPSSARAVISDHSVRGALLTGLAGKQDISEEIVQAFNAFVDALFEPADKNNRIKEALSKLTVLANSKTVQAVVVDQIEPGTISAWHLDETSDRAMIQNALDMAKRHATPAGRGVLRERKAAFAITLAPGLAEGTNGDLVAELLALRDQVSALQVPILIHAPAEGDRIVTQSEAGLVVHVSQILTRLGINPGSLASGVRVQVVASPTSTVNFNKDGLSVNAVVEKILWLLEGIGLRVSTEDTEKEMHSLIAALKAA